MPSGILWGKECVLGAGCVVDPAVFIEELDDLEARGSRRVGAPLGQRAADHALARRARPGERAPARQAPDRHHAARRARVRRQGGRLGIRVQDLLDPKILRQKIEVALAEKNHWLEQVYGAEPIDLEDVSSRYESYAQRLRPYIADTSLLVDRALRDDRFVLFEGAQGTLLDLDHGTYPFVTSSNPVAGAANGHRDRAEPDRRRSRRGEGLLTRVGEGRFRPRSRAPTRSGCASSAANTARSPEGNADAAGSTSSACATPRA